MVLDLLSLIVLTVIGLFVLIKGANYLVEGATDVARWLRVSPILVGLTIVAFGTSLPEFIVSLFSVIGNNSDISLGNIIGSNIANIGLVIGISAIIISLSVKSQTLIYEFPFLIVSTFLLLILGNDQFIFNKDTFILSRIDGLILLTIFAFFLYYIYLSFKEDRKQVKEEFGKTLVHKNLPWKNFVLISGGIVALITGGKLFIGAAQKLIVATGMSEAFLGLTIAAIGTSLPEVVTSIVAAWKKQGDLAIGNIVGSNIFNILLVLGATSIIKPININSSILNSDGIVMLFLSLLFLVFATRKQNIYRKEGILLLAIYLVYLTFVIWRL